MLVPQRLLDHLDRATIEFVGPCVVSSLPMEFGEVTERFGELGVIGGQRLLSEGQRRLVPLLRKCMVPLPLMSVAGSWPSSSTVTSIGSKA